MGALRRLLKRERITSALSARIPLAKFSGPTPAAKAISRHRQMSAMSVSLDRTLVARPLSTRALTSSAKGNWHCSTSPLRRRSSRTMVTGGRDSACCRSEEILSNLNVLTWPTCVCRDKDIDERLGIS
jgi:hypothetical protein